MLEFFPTLASISIKHLRTALVILAAFLSLCVFADRAQAQTTYFVNGATGNDISNSCTAPNDACKTIDVALDKVTDGDTVKIAPWANPYDEYTVVTQPNITIEGTGAKAEDVLIQNRFQNGADGTIVRNLRIDNPNGGGVLNAGNMTMENVVISGDNRHCGGGIATQPAVTPRGFPKTTATTLNLINSTVTGSTSKDSGGGICAKSVINIINSTISGNNALGSDDPAFASVTGMGGGIYVWGGTVRIYNSIIAENDAANTGGAISVSGGTGYILELYNTLIADNLPNNCQANDKITGGGFNLEDANSCGDNVLFPVHGDPLLDTLEDNGGATPTHALLDGSPAIDAGDPDGCKGPNNAPLNHDQTGHQRVGRCDIGSFEYVPAGWVPPPPSPSPIPTPTTTPSDPGSGTTVPGPAGSPGNLPGSDAIDSDNFTGDSTPGTDGSSPGGLATGGCSINATQPTTDFFWLFGMALLGLRSLFYRKNSR